MKKLLFLLSILLINKLCLSQSLDSIADSILNEGLIIYKLEKAAWISTDKLAEEPLNFYFINGFIPYYDDDTIRTIFYYHDSFGTRIKFTGNISRYDSIISSKLIFNSTDRKPNDKELLIIKVKSDLNKLIESSTNFTQYAHLLNYNISVIERDTLLIFNVLPGSTRNDLFYFGGDYVIKYSNNQKLVAIEPQHSSLIEMKPPNNTQINSSTHSHIKDFSPYITATDICQAKLYGKLTNNCSIFSVVSEHYESTFNTETDELTIVKWK